MRPEKTSQGVPWQICAVDIATFLSLQEMWTGCQLQKADLQTDQNQALIRLTFGIAPGQFGVGFLEIPWGMHLPHGSRN